MVKIFDSIKIRKPKTNVFDLSHEKKLSCNMGDLVPIYLQEVVPGDKFRVNTEIFMRLAPMLAPIMHRVNVFTHYFFVPNRLVFDRWQDFITGGENGKEVISMPVINFHDDLKYAFAKGTLADYFGIVPVDPTSTVERAQTINALPFRAYQMIWNEYYRDQNLSSPIPFAIGQTVTDDTEAETIMMMRQRCWEKDYFTSALPWAQRGDEVLLPLQMNLDGESFEVSPTSGASANPANLSVVNGILNIETTPSGSQPAHIEGADAINNANTTINDLRRALKLQEWLEKNARAGSRYIEQILAHFGVRTPDYRLQRPEYLGGGKNPVVISEVLNQTAGVSNKPVGDMYGHGISIGNQNTFSKYFTEHGLIIGIMSVLPRTAYQQGIDKLFLKTDKFDYYFPEFANIGEQEISLKELYYDWTAAQFPESDLWGYTPRYAEYKFKQGSVHGDFRDSLSFWHMGRIFGQSPQLIEDFMFANPTHRIFANTTETDHKLWVQLYNNVRAIRPMPVYGTPIL